MFGLDNLADRLQTYCADRGWRTEAAGLLLDVLHRGEISHGEALPPTGLRERTGRDLLGALVTDGILGSDSPKGAVSLRFPIKALDLLFPRLFQEI